MNMRLICLAALLAAPFLLPGAADLPLDFSRAANMDYRDEVAGDGKGGWSDQGPNNDLRNFDFKRKDFEGMTFSLLDPAKNGGRAVMTFDSPRFKTGLTEAVFNLADIPQGRFLYLLHTSCWNTEKAGSVIGNVEVTLGDGNVIRYEICSGREINDWWSPSSGPNSRVVARQKNGDTEVGLFLSKIPLSPHRDVGVKSVRFSTAGKVVWIVLGATLSSRNLDVSDKCILYQPNDEWKIIDTSDIKVKAGSVLDLSALSEAGPAGKHGRVIIGKGGSLAFADSPDTPRRFQGFNGLYKTKFDDLGRNPEQMKEYVALLKRNGYTMVRPLILDHYALLGATKDAQINPERLDHLDRLIAELKANGIYTYLTLGAYRLGFVEAPWLPNDYRQQMYIGGERIRSNWKSVSEQLLNHVNPYTGLAWKDDPAIACVEFYNEQEWGMCNLDVSLSAETRKLYVDGWGKWLLKKYKTPAAIAKALEEPELAAPGALETKLTLPRGVDMPGAKARELGLFFRDLARDQMAWCEKVVRDAGYPGLISQFNCSKMVLDSLVRQETSPVVSMNGYFVHPTAHNSPGSRVTQESSIEKMGNYWRSCAATKLTGHPLIMTEYNHSFWNAWQHEAGLLFAAYSSLQDFSTVLVHEDPVQLKHEKPLSDFGVAESPIARANEFLSACLFSRRDVSTAKRQVELRIPESYLERNGNLAVNADQVKLALVTGFSLTFPGQPEAAGVKAGTGVLAISPEPGSVIWGVVNAATAVEDSPGDNPQLVAAMKTLKAKGILPADNITDPEKGIFQSDTGEIVMRAKEKLLKVTTPRTEAVSLTANASERMGRFEVRSSSVDAMVATCAMDGKPLSSSSRIVLIYSTDAVNNGMELSEDRITLRKLGSAEILLKVGKLEASLANANAGRMSLYALGLNGERREKLPLSIKNGKLELNIDTGTLKNGPTPFFELVAEQN